MPDNFEMQLKEARAEWIRRHPASGGSRLVKRVATLHGHYQMDGDAEAVVRQFFDA